jgi:signal transduction histidine kinase
MADPELSPFGESLTGWKAWALILLPALLLGLVEAAQLRLGSAVLGRPMPFPLAVVRVVPYWLLLGLLAPLVFAAARRFKVTRHLLWPNALGLAASAVAFALLTLAGRLAVGPISPGIVPWTPIRLFQTYFLLDVLTYTALVGTLYAFHFYRHAESREIAASQLDARLSEARLEALQTKLEPHFLFNTLNAISVLALEGNQAAVVDTVRRLSELLRVSLNHDRPHEVPLGRELELIEGYLAIQRIRFGDRLVVTYDVAPDVSCAAVPTMILQPIVENAVVHGISTTTGTCHVAVCARREHSMLRLEITDTGRGFPDVEQLRAGIGLVSTRARLQQMYGAAPTIEFSNVARKGARVSISMPFHQVAPLHALSA